MSAISPGRHPPLVLLCAAAVASVCLSGCVRYHPRPLDPAAAADAFGGRKLDDPGLRTFAETNLNTRLDPWPPASWDLTDLTLAAFYYHPSLDLARARWEAAKAQGITAGQRRNPDLNLTPGYNTSRSVPSPWLPLAFLDIPLETAGKRGHRIARAERLAEAARLDVASTAWQVRSGVRSALAAFDAAREGAKLLEERQTLEEENVRLLEGQYKAGAISAFELTQARIAADETAISLRDARRRSDEARVRLAAAVGLPSAALEGAEFSAADLDRAPAEGSLSEARHQALMNRSDILGALADYAASESALQLEIARQYPDIHLLPGYQYDQGEDKWTLGLTVTLPLMNRNKGGIAEAEAGRSEAAAKFNLLQASVVASIDVALAASRAALQTRADAEALLARLREQETRSQALYDAGEISRSELVALRLQINASDQSRLEALARAREALGALEDALQSPLGLPPSAWQVPPRPPAAEAAKEHP